ncbi:MAG TPA: L-lactate permease [Noviherbaspirillum sp.]|nr:L-lactate permease [Noviherbaspirillum sp.]
MSALAALPIAVILVLMIGLGWSAARAGALGLVAALVIAWAAFGLGARVMPELGAAAAAGGALGEAVFLALTILWIIFPALCIHELQVRTGSIDVLRVAMTRIAGDARILALLVAWFFGLFIEGAAGFGTSVALAAPFLVSAGFGRVAAVSMALIGHAIGVSFGAVGTPVVPQAAVSGLSPLAIAGATANYHLLIGWMMPLAVMFLATRAQAATPASRVAPAPWGWTFVAAACFLVPYYLIARLIGPELPTLAGALVGGLLFVGALRMARRRSGAEADATRAADLLRAAAPYLLLIALVVCTRMIGPLQERLRAVEIAWTYASFGGSMQILYHPGTMLLASFLLGALVQRVPAVTLREAIGAVLRRLLPVTVALAAMLGLSRVMVHAGMIDALAAAAAAAAAGTWPALWPVLAPAIGLLGTFVTGSATASNILFTEFQVATAERLGLSVLGLTAAQGFGAAIGNIICPHNIVAASATVQLVGREGEVLRRTLLPALACALAGGFLALWLYA